MHDQGSKFLELVEYQASLASHVGSGQCCNLESKTGLDLCQMKLLVHRFSQKLKLSGGEQTLVFIL